MTNARLGCSKDDLDTPALCLDLDVMEQNIRTMVAVCREHGVGWRPHAKCHKSAAIGRLLTEAGANGLTCAKLGEAEVMAAAGIRDLLVANMIVGPRKIERLVALREIADPIICLDHLDQAEPISRALAAAGLTVRVLVEVDLGMERVGVPPGDAVLSLVRQLLALPGLSFAGLMGYEGHLLTLANSDEKELRIDLALDELVESAELLRRAGIECPIVSCGGTGCYWLSAAHRGITEIQAGGAIFMDEFYRNKCHVPTLDFALTVLTTVVSRPRPDRAVIDAGRKAMNPDLQPPRVRNRDGITVTALSAEHGILRLAPSAQDLKIGDRLELIPGYGDLTTMLHDAFHVFRAGRLVAIWPLEARGKF